MSPDTNKKFQDYLYTMIDEVILKEMNEIKFQECDSTQIKYEKGKNVKVISDEDFNAGTGQVDDFEMMEKTEIEKEIAGIEITVFDKIEKDVDGDSNSEIVKEDDKDDDFMIIEKKREVIEVFVSKACLTDLKKERIDKLVQEEAEIVEEKNQQIMKRQKLMKKKSLQIMKK